MVTDSVRMVERLLLLTRLEARREPIQKITIDMYSVVKTALREIADKAQRRHLDLPTIPKLPAVVGDLGYRLIVVRNLLDNAVAHASELTAISITWAPTGNHSTF